MAPTSVLRLIENISRHSDNDMSKVLVIQKTNPSATNRANSMGDALEFFVKDSFCNSYAITDGIKKSKVYSSNFSYLGNQNNPPDIIILGSDAIEVKKIDGVKPSDLALNSSYPKAKLYSDSPLITTACKSCEKWTEKDLAYIVGFVDKNKLKVLVIVYGDCYAASREIYDRIQNTVSNGLNALNVELAKTKELGRVNKVDPLGITNLRIRGMWTIKSPLAVFSDFLKYDVGDKLTVFAIMRKEKFNSHNKKEREIVKSLKNSSVEAIKFKEPNNPAMLADGVLVKLVVQ